MRRTPAALAQPATETWRDVLVEGVRFLESVRPAPIDMGTLVKLNTLLLPESNPYRGRFHEGSAFVRLGGVVHRRAPPPVEGHAMCAETLLWLNRVLDDGCGEATLVTMAADLIFRVTEAHVFLDGNGRVGRALATWLLLRSGYELKADPRTFCRERKYAYYRALGRRQGRIGGIPPDRGPWDEFMADMVAACFHAHRSPA